MTGTPVRIDEHPRGPREAGAAAPAPTAVQAAAAVGGRRGVAARARLAAQLVVRARHACGPGEYRFAIGTAGSTTLVLQTVLPALLTAAGRRRWCSRAARTTRGAAVRLPRARVPAAARAHGRRGVEATLERARLLPGRRRAHRACSVDAGAARWRRSSSSSAARGRGAARARAGREPAAARSPSASSRRCARALGLAERAAVRASSTCAAGPGNVRLDRGRERARHRGLHRLRRAGRARRGGGRPRAVDEARALPGERTRPWASTSPTSSCCRSPWRRRALPHGSGVAPPDDERRGDRAVPGRPGVLRRVRAAPMGGPRRLGVRCRLGSCAGPASAASWSFVSALHSIDHERAPLSRRPHLRRQDRGPVREPRRRVHRQVAQGRPAAGPGCRGGAGGRRVLGEPAARGGLRARDLARVPAAGARRAAAPASPRRCRSPRGRSRAWHPRSSGPASTSASGGTATACSCGARRA